MSPRDEPGFANRTLVIFSVLQSSVSPEGIMDDVLAIRLAKTELREGYEAGDVDRVLSVFADQYNDMSVGRPSFYGAEAKAVFRHRVTKLFARYRVKLGVTIISFPVEGALATDWGWHKLTLAARKHGTSHPLCTRSQQSW